MCIRDRLYDLTTLQKEANAKHGFTAEQTLEIAQKLYEKKLDVYKRQGTLRYRCDRRFLLCILVVCCGDVDVQEVVCAADVLSLIHI